jgi:hypothetical protein
MIQLCQYEIVAVCVCVFVRNLFTILLLLLLYYYYFTIINYLLYIYYCGSMYIVGIFLYYYDDTNFIILHSITIGAMVLFF